MHLLSRRESRRCRSWCGGDRAATAAVSQSQWAVLWLDDDVMTCRRNRKPFLQHFFRRNLTFFGLLLKLDQSHRRSVGILLCTVQLQSERSITYLFKAKWFKIFSSYSVARPKRATLRTFDSVFIYNWSNQYTSSLLFVEIIAAKEKLSPPVTTRTGH